MSTDDEPDPSENGTDDGVQLERTIDVEGRQMVEQVVQDEQRERLAEHAEGESTRERLLAAKQKRELEAEPFEHTFEQTDTEDADLDELLVGETFEFRTFPKELKSRFEEAALKFAGAEEDELTSEQAREMERVNDAILDALDHHATDPTLDRTFWREMTDMEDRQIMAGQLMAAQGK